MFTFKKGNYTFDELYTLNTALETALASIPCNHNCDNCANLKPCRDLRLVCDYIQTIAINTQRKNP